MSEARYFYFWCVNCPTRITVETEVPEVAPAGQPQYDFAMFEWVGQVQVGDTRKRADRCPACGGQLWDVDELAARGDIPLNTFTAEAHAAWRREEKNDGP